MYAYTSSHNPITSIHLLHQQITIHSGCSDRRRNSLDLLAAANSAGLLRYTLTRRFTTVLLIRQFWDIRNKAVGHFKRKYKLFIVVFVAQQFCGQSDLLIDCRSLLPPYPRKYTLSCVVLRCRYIRENASPEIRLVSSRKPKRGHASAVAHKIYRSERKVFDQR